jgi:hypothetical protein
MMKKLLFTTIIALNINLASAQIQSEDFEAGVLPDGWTTQISGPGEWTLGTTPPFSGNPTFASQAIMFDDNALGDVPASMASLISPTVDVSSSASLFVAFDYYMNAYINAGSLKVEVYDGSAWQEILFAGADVINMTHFEYDATAFKNAAFQVKFTFDDENDWSWGTAIDNFSLTQTLGIPKFEARSFDMSPNPVSNELNVVSKNIIKKITIHTISGQEVSNQNVAAQQAKINTGSLLSGVYFVTTTFDNNITRVQKLVKK